MHQLRSPTTDLASSLAIDILESYAAAEHESPSVYGHDCGPMVLVNVAASVNAIPDELQWRVARRWLAELPDKIYALGAFGGLGGFLTGIRAGIPIDDQFSLLYERMSDQTGRLLAAVRWRMSAVAWADYDLFRGPAGLVLAGVTSGGATEPFVPAARYLARQCDDPGLEGLRAGTEIHPHSAFNIGRINTGMGHGVTGVAAALRHASETFNDGCIYRPALRRACDWLIEQAYLADDDFITWPMVGRDGAKPTGFADRRQAWCYGTPGVAWTLWDAGRVLEDSSLQLLAEEAMRSFCRVFDPDYHLDKHDIGEELGICHGVAGLLAVADAFARYTGLSEAASLRDYLDQCLLSRVDHVADIARTDMTMLSGAGGIVSVLMSVHGGTRSWLSLIALR